MKFEDVFPYDKEEFSFVVRFFNKYTEYKRFSEFFEGQAEGTGFGIHEFSGINLPNGEDQNMM